MPNFASLKTDIQRHLNDRSGGVFTDDDEFVTALQDALREIALIRDPRSRREVFPREFMAFMSNSAEIAIGKGELITLPTDSLRIISGNVGAAVIEAVKGPDYEWHNSEAISVATIGSPWIVSNGSSSQWEIWPVGQWEGFKATIRYVTDPPPYENADPAVVRAMTLTAARNMAADREMPTMAELLRRRAYEALATAIGFPFMAPVAETGNA